MTDSRGDGVVGKGGAKLPVVALAELDYDVAHDYFTQAGVRVPETDQRVQLVRAALAKYQTQCPECGRHYEEGWAEARADEELNELWQEEGP